MRDASLHRYGFPNMMIQIRNREIFLPITIWIFSIVWSVLLYACSYSSRTTLEDSTEIYSNHERATSSQPYAIETSVSTLEIYPSIHNNITSSPTQVASALPTPIQVGTPDENEYQADDMMKLKERLTLVPPSYPELDYSTIVTKPVDIDGSPLSIAIAFWSKNEKIAYFALSENTISIGEPLNWSSFDIGSGETKPLISLPPITKPLSRYIYPMSEELDYQVLKGMISPSGRYQLGEEIIEKGELSTTYRLSLFDGLNNTRNDILEGGFIQQAVWFDNETRVMFCMQLEIGCPMYVVNTQNCELDRSFVDFPILWWMLSPDEKNLAFIDTGYRLLIVDIYTKELISIDGQDTVETEFDWSNDGQAIYYWHGGSEPIFEPKELRRYNLEESISNTVLRTDSPVAQGLCKYGCNFDVAPSNAKALLWDDDGLWIVPLN